MNWADFFNMGGYAFYVWSSWGLTFVVMAYQVVAAKWNRLKTIGEVKRQLAREQILNNEKTK